MRNLLPLLPRPSRYLGIEPHSVHKDQAAVSFRAALAFPDTYEVGMSYLGQKILYAQINSRQAWQAERVFAPELEAAAVLRAHSTPLATLESDTPLNRCTFIGFSITHELCYTNVLYMLELAGLPLSSRERAATPGLPLVLAGGGGTLAAEPLAPFVDLMLLGEAEDILPDLLALMEQQADPATGLIRDRTAFLLAAARLPGMYVPEFFEADASGAARPLHPELPAPARRIAADFDAAPYPIRQVTPFGAVHNRLALEIARGCTRGCRFCQAGMTGRPVRERRIKTLVNLAHTCLSETGFEDISFLSLSTGDYSGLKTLFGACVERCAAEEISLSLPSLRVGSIDDDIMARMAEIRRTGATLAPEAGSERLRAVINKGITEEALLRHVQKLFEYGWTQVKLYFMIGLPTETDEDILAIADLARRVRDCPGPGVKRLQVTVAVSPFVPKPHTPFQWEQQADRQELRRRIGLLLEAIKKEKRISMRWHDPEESFLEGVLSRAGRELAPVVERAFRKGAVFPSWAEHFTLTPWLEALAEEGLDPAAYQAARPHDAPLPWDHLENGTSKAFLLRELARALEAKESPDCRYASCHACGACDLPGAPSRLPALENGAVYKNILNFPERDQQGNAPRLDDHGRVIIWGEENRSAAPAGKRKGPPPAPPEHLTRKAMQVLLLYEKRDRAAYLSQLELQSLFERALRRAHVPLSFSRGYHPLPLLSFGRALPVGVASLEERLSLYLREDRDPASLAGALGEILPGLRVTASQLMPPAARGLDSPTERFLLSFTGNEVRKADFRRLWLEFSSKESLPWLRETKKGLRSLNARAFFLEIAEAENGGLELHCTWEGGYVSPLALCRAVFDGMIQPPFPPAALTEFSLTKLPAVRWPA